MRILVIASHSGGHLAPAIAFCQAMWDRAPDTKINFVTTDSAVERHLLFTKFNRFKVIYFKKQRISFINFYKFFFLCLAAYRILKSEKPELVVGFGGYLSIPFIVISKIFKIPHFIHEQNVRIGLANRLLMRICDNIVFSFSTSALYCPKDKAKLLGNPIRKEIERMEQSQAKRYFNFEPNKFTILVLGGSQGSRYINFQMIGVFETGMFNDCQVIHITGFNDYERIKKRYESLGMEARIYDFFEPMQYAFNASDIIICRAGASTLAEIIYLQLVAIVIPYPYARAHQRDNAQFFAEKGACILLDEKFATLEKLCSILKELKSENKKIEEIKKNIRNIKTGNNRWEFADFAFSIVSKN